MATEKIEYRMATINNMIEIDKLSFSYNGQPVLKDVSLKITGNEFTVLLGQNGSGKSTLMRVMAGLLPKYSGNVQIRGKDLHKMSSRDRARSIGFLAQQHKAVFPFTVKEVVLTGRAAYIGFVPGKKDVQIAFEAIEKVGIEYLLNRVYSELSGGEQQLVMIARALAQQPEILLLDEPISHLDYNNQLRIISLIKQLVKQGITVAAVLHDPNMAFLFGDRFVYFHNKQVFDARDKKPWEHEWVKEVFHDDMYTVSHEGKCIFIPRIA
jgi:iron complex transport system ATP-binding protein